MSKLKERFINMSAPAKAAIFFTICNILQKGISLISTPIFTRLLTTQQYGVYTIYNSLYSIISIFATINLSYGVFLTGLTKFEQDRQRFTSALIGLSTTITGVLFVIYLLFKEFWNNLFELSTLIMVTMFVEMFFVPAFYFWSNVQRNIYRYKALVAITLGMSIANPFIGIVAVSLSEHKAEARILTSVFVQVCVGLVFYVLQAYRGKKLYVKKYWKYALAFNIPLIPHYLSMTALQQADRVMIGRMEGTTQAAIYGIAYTVSTLMTLVTQAINNSFTPFTYQALKTKKYSDIGKIANLLLVLVGSGCICAMAFGPEIIKIFAPKEYYEAIWIIPPVSASVYFMFLYPLFGNIEFYFAKTKFTMLASCGGAIVNIILNYIFIKQFGYLAAGYTTLACYVLFAVLHFVAYNNIRKNRLEQTTVYNIKFMAFFSLVMLLVMGFVLIIYNNFIVRYLLIIIICGLLFGNRTKIIKLLKKQK